MTTEGVEKSRTLVGKRILIAENEWLIADAIASAVEAAGGQIIGPFPTIKQSLAALTGDTLAPDAATLNIRLNDGESYSVADRLAAMKVPFIFASANGSSSLPRRFSRRVLLGKPVAAKQVIEALIVITSP